MKKYITVAMLSLFFCSLFLSPVLAESELSNLIQQKNRIETLKQRIIILIDLAEVGGRNDIHVVLQELLFSAEKILDKIEDRINNRIVEKESEIKREENKKNNTPSKPPPLPPLPATSGSISCSTIDHNKIRISYSVNNSSNARLFRGASVIITIGSGTSSSIVTASNLSPDTDYTFYLRDGTNSTATLLAKVNCRTKIHSWDTLKKDILTEANKFNGKIYLYIKDYNENRHIVINPNTSVPAASVIKVQIMAAAFDAQQKGEISLSEKIILRDKDKVGGSPILGSEPDGRGFTIRQLIEYMISVSDNTATNLLIDRLGLNSMNSRFDSIGLHDTILNRKMMVNDGSQNYVTANDMAYILDSFYLNNFINSNVSSECIKIMKSTSSLLRIRRNLPKEVIVAHKTGSLAGETKVAHDAGIVFTKNGDFLIVALVDYNDTQKSANMLIGEIASLVYQYYIGN